jgi:hypothetical protein
VAFIIPLRPLLYGRDLAFVSGSVPAAATLMFGEDSHRLLTAVDAVAPGAAADLLGSTIPVGDRTLGSAINTAHFTPTARLSERERFTGDRERITRSGSSRHQSTGSSSSSFGIPERR